MNKQALLKKVVARLRDELSLYAKAARSARAEATDEQSKAENKYDTRGLEASYLARGQSRQAAEITAAITELEAMTPRAFAPGEPIQPGALVTLEVGRERLHYFLLPRGGGTEVTAGGTEILVITPQSPVGQAVLNKAQGLVLELEFGGPRQKYRIVEVA